MESVAFTGPSVALLPQTHDDLLCVELHDVVRLADYEEIFLKALRRVSLQYGHFRAVYVYAADFRGWEEDAAGASLKSIVDFGRFARKVAYVNPPETKIIQVKMTRSLLGGEVRYFEADQMDAAVAWVNGPDGVPGAE